MRLGVEICLFDVNNTCIRAIQTSSLKGRDVGANP